MAKHPGGRPTKYRKSYCAALIAHMADGLSYESFAATIDVSRDTLYEWEKRHPQFSDAKKLGEDRSLLWWEQIGKAAMLGNDVKLKTGQILSMRNFNPTIWIFSMKNRHGWRDRHDHQIVAEIKPFVVETSDGDTTTLGVSRGSSGKPEVTK